MSTDVARHIAHRIVKTINEDINIGDQIVRIGASIGLSVSQINQHSANLLAAADTAAYVAKKQGRNNVAETHTRCPDRSQQPAGSLGPLGSRKQDLPERTRPAGWPGEHGSKVCRRYFAELTTSKRSRFMTLTHADTKSPTNFCSASLEA